MEAVEIIRGALNECPNNYKLMDALMFHLHFYANSLGEPEKRCNLRQHCDIGRIRIRLPLGNRLVGDYQNICQLFPFLP